MNAPLRIAKLSRADKAPFVALMSQAFSQDPLFLHLFGDPGHNPKASRGMSGFISFLFDKSRLLHEEIWGIAENGTLLGAYIVEKPHAGKLRTLGGGLLLLGRLLPLLSVMSGKTLSHLNDYMRVTRSASPPWKHHYLIMIGVNPEYQGRGIGKALLNHVLHEANRDRSSQGVALDTENPENVSLYRKFGFTLGNTTEINQLPVYCMFWQKDTSLSHGGAVT